MQSLPYDPMALLANSTPRVIIAPGYRLNLFGFLCAPELSSLNEDPAPGNYGFWDQRMALEWTSRNISHFGGDPSNISVGGLSAGAYSAFFQLYHDTFLAPQERLIKRAYLWSNAIGIQPNYPNSPSQTRQFADLLAHFSIPASASPSEKISALRAIPSADLIAALAHLPLHTFRATTDSSFIPPSFLPSIHSGALASQLKKNGTSLMLGECSDEGLLYRLINPPSSLSTLRTQLENYYPPPVVSALLSIYPHPSSTAPAVAWQDLYGRITGDCQVHCTLRGLVHCLLNPPNPKDAMPIDKVLRYKICWRAKALDRILKPELGVCHGADTPIWWASGFRAGFTAEDREKTKEWLEPFGKFLSGEEVGGEKGWGTNGEKERREMGTDGVARVLEDEESWGWGMRIWRAMWDAQQEGNAKAKI
jgi:carboxylesterase type B